MSKLPDGWRRVRLGEVLPKVQRSIDVRPTELYHQIGIRSHGKGIFHKEPITGLEIGDKRIFWVEPGDFVLNIVFAWEGAIALVSEAERGMCASHRFPTFVADKTRCDPRFVLRYFQTPRGVWDLGLASPGGAGRNRTLSQSDFLDLQFALPPLTEQQNIADILDTWDEAIALVEALIAALKHRKQGLMQRLLTGEVRFPGFEDEWQEVRLGKVAKLVAGGTPSTTNSNYWNGNVKWMRSGDVHKKRILDVDGRISEAGLKNSSAQMIPLNSVLVALAGQGKTRGTVAINKIELATNQSVAAIITDELKLHYGYLFANLDYRYDELRQLSTGAGGRGGLNLSILGAINVPQPPITEQVQIAEILEVCDRQVEELTGYSELLRDQKRGLMQRLLTGEVRVRTTEEG